MVVVAHLAADEQAGDRGALVVVGPQPAHREVRAGGDAHGHRVRIFVGGFPIELKQVAVALGDDVAAQPIEGITKVEVDAVVQRADAVAGVDLLASGPRRDVARRQVAVAGVLALQVVVAIGLGDVVGWAVVGRQLGHPHPAVVAQRLAHQRRLGLPWGVHRQRGRMELHEAGRGEVGAALVGPPGRRRVGVLGER